MKRFSFPLLVLVWALVGVSCKKNSPVKPNAGPLGSNYPAALNAIVTPAMIATLESAGANIYDGLTPPVINGIYLFSPNYCTFDNSGYNLGGQLFSDFKFQFSNQDNNTSTVTVNFKDIDNPNYVWSDAASTATYISGNSGSFTVFSENTGVEQGVSTVTLSIVSGILLSDGDIQNLQWTQYWVSKGADPNNVVVPVGTTRIFEDWDGLSSLQATFSLPTSTIQSIGTAHDKTMMSVGQSH